MLCREFCEIADSYLGDELLVETNHDVLQHLEACTDCRRELAARRDVRDKLRRAFAVSPALQLRTEFAGELSTQLQSGDTRERQTLFFPRPAWLALAACLLVAGAFGLRALRQTPTPQLSSQREQTSPPSQQLPVPAQSVQESATYVAISELSESAAGDHRDCAVNFRLAEIPVELNEAGEKYDRAFLNLDQAVSDKSEMIAEDVEIVESHACVFQGRRFGHVVLRYRGHIVSLLVTDRDGGAMQRSTRLETVSDATTQVSACAPSSGYQVSGFETARHAVFVVSDLSETENLRLARALAPRVRAHVASAESAV